MELDAGYENTGSAMERAGAFRLCQEAKGQA